MAIDGVSRELVEKANCGIYVEPENEVEYGKEAGMTRLEGRVKEVLSKN